MANIKRNVEIIISGKDDLSGSLKKATIALGAFAAAGLAYAFNESVKLENATIELAKVMGNEADQLDDMKKAAFDLSMEYGQSATSALESAANFKQAGFTAEEAMKLTKNSLDLVIAGDLEAAQASELLVSGLKGFKAPAAEAGRYIDILNEVSNNYATDVEQLGIGMATISPIASQMGFSFEETAGLLTPVIEVFRSGDEAANALKTGLLRLGKDAPRIKEALKSIGVAQKDANRNLRSGKDILHDVASAFSGLTNEQKTYIATELSGINQAPKMIEVFNGLAKSTEITATAMGSAGSVAAEVATRLASTEVSLNRVMEGFNNIAASIGDRFRPQIAEASGEFADFEKDMLDAVQGGSFDLLVQGFQAGIGLIWNYWEVLFNYVVAGFLTIAEKALWVAEKLTFWSDTSDSIKEARDSLILYRDASVDVLKEDAMEGLESAKVLWETLKGNVVDAADAAKKADLTPKIDKQAVEAVKKTLDEAIPQQRQEEVIVTLDDGSVVLTNKTMADLLPGTTVGDVSVYTTNVKAEPDKESVKTTSEYIIAELNAATDLQKTAIQYRAEVDVAEIEASTRVFESSIESITTGMESTADLMKSAFEGMESSSFTARYEARRVLEEEMKLRKEEFALQKKLIEAKTKALEKGDLGFTIDTTGLEPALELVMWQILEKVQVRANETEAEFLLGLNA